MQIVVTHEMADFDAIASAFAARKLHPEAAVVVGRHLGGKVRDFLNLHRDRLPTLRLEDVDFRSVEHAIVVDVRRASRLEGIEPLLDRIRAQDPSLKVTIYDHHAAAPDDLSATDAVIEAVGSATTLLVERIRARGIEIDGVEATLFALGIHEDTGSLTYAGTTARDADALAWLLRSGVSLRVLERYLKRSLVPAQRAVLVQLLSTSTIERIGEVDVAVAMVELERQLTDLGEVVSRAAELEGAAAFFAVFPIAGRRVQVIARSSTPFVHAGRVLATFGGGGHAAAASGIVRHGDAALVRRELLEALNGSAGRPLRVSDVMTAPVRTVPPELTMHELELELAASGHSGAPVVGAAGIAGVATRRDVERARKDGQLDAPVRRYMTREPLVVGPDEPLESALERMTVANVGRLPVVHGGELVGIVTRSDVIRTLYARK